jgi:hypothetical protein
MTAAEIRFAERYTAQRRGGDDADAPRVGGDQIEPGLVQRLARGGQRVLADAIEARDFLGRQPLVGTKVGDLAGQRVAQAGGVERADRRERAAAGEQALPERGDTATQGGDGPASGDERARQWSTHEVSPRA